MRQAAADLEWPNTYHTFITTMQTAYHGGKHSECMSDAGINCEAQARVRQGLARDGSQGERPQSFNPCLELTLKLVATTTTHHHPPP